LIPAEAGIRLTGGRRSPGRCPISVRFKVNARLAIVVFDLAPATVRQRCWSLAVFNFRSAVTAVTRRRRGLDASTSHATLQGMLSRNAVYRNHSIAAQAAIQQREQS